MKLLTIAFIVAASPAIADTYVNGYIKNDGTYVAPHFRSNNDGARWNNYSTQGNANPYTGQRGSESSLQPIAPTIRPQPIQSQDWNRPYQVKGISNY